MHPDFEPTTVQDPLRHSASHRRAPVLAGGRWFARVVRWLCAMADRQGAPAGQAHIDPCTGLLSRRGLLARAGVAMRAGQARRRTLAMVIFDCEDLLEAHELYGSTVSRLLMDRVAQSMDRLAGARGWAARSGPAQFTVVLPVASAEAALAAVRRSLGASPCIEFDAGGEEIVLVPEFVAGCTDAQDGSAEPLYLRLCAELARAQEMRRRRWSHMRRERQRHSRPMELPAANDVRFTFSQAAPTVPLQLSAAH